MMIRHEVIENLAAERDLWKKEFMAMKGEVERLTAEIAEKEGECERQVDRIIEQEEAIKRLQEALSEEEFQRKRAESLAASRLADQEAIERHTAKMVAGEIMAEIDDLDTETDADFYLCGYIFAANLRYRIRKKYGVE